MELAAAAAELGYPAFALTDHDGVWGSMEFVHACRGLGMRAITGAELTVEVGPGGPVAGRYVHLTLLVHDATGYRNLCRLLTAAHSHTRANTGRSAEQPWVSLEQIEEHAEGLVCLSGCAGKGAVAGAFERGEPAAGAELARRLLAVFGNDRFRVELQRPFWRRDRARNRWLAGLAERLGATCVATGNVHSHARSRAQLQDALVAVRLGVTLEESEPRRRGNPTSALASPRAMAARFAEHPDAVAETLRLAERLQFDLARSSATATRAKGTLAPTASWRRYVARCWPSATPGWSTAAKPKGSSRRSCGRSAPSASPASSSSIVTCSSWRARWRARCGAGVGALDPAAGPRSRLQRQLDRLLPHRPLPHRPGEERASFPAASSTRNRQGLEATMPDIDLDFPRDIRERLILRVHDRYGADRSALVAAFPTYRPRGAVRDLGKALGLPPEELERVAKMVGFHERSGEIEKTSSRRSAPSVSPRHAGRRCCGSVPRSWDCPATLPSTRAAW
jgi:error-prone DNA polymerase